LISEAALMIALVWIALSFHSHSDMASPEKNSFSWSHGEVDQGGDPSNYPARSKPQGGPTGAPSSFGAKDFWPRHRMGMPAAGKYKRMK